MPAEIDAKGHRSQQRAAKVRNLSKNGAIEVKDRQQKEKTKGPDLFGENCWPGYEKKRNENYVWQEISKLREEDED